MPSLLRYKGYRFYFYSHEAGEPPHVHVDRAGSSAKFWMESITVVRSRGFSSLELREIARIISHHRLVFLRQWNDYFNPT